MLTAISNLFGVGGASAIARALGRQDEEGARRIAAVSLAGGLLSALLFSAVFRLLVDPVLCTCAAPPRLPMLRLRIRQMGRHTGRPLHHSQHPPGESGPGGGRRRSRRLHSLLYSLYTMGNELPLGDQVFILQSRIIKQLAEEGPCVILGRCGDYVLRERKDVLRVFIYAPVEWRRELAKTDPL